MQTFCTLAEMTDHHSRFRTATTYSGHAPGHDYKVTVNHSPWRTKVLALAIDDVEHIPATDTADASSTTIESQNSDKTDTDDEGSKHAEVSASGWLNVRITVKRPTVEGKLVDREVIYVNTAALGRAGEVEVRSDLDVSPLLPEPGSRSEARDLKRTARPNTFALIAGLTTALRLIIPLLGLGALFAFITEPVKAWLSRHLSPILDPIFAWLGQRLEPAGRLLMAIGRFIGSVIDFLFGWLPSFHLPFDTPDWVWTSAKIALLALVAFSVSRSNLKRRQKQLEQTQSRSDKESTSSS